MTTLVAATAYTVNGLAEWASQHQPLPLYPLAVETLADRLEAARERAGISQRELSRRAGLADSQYGVTLARLRKNPNSEVSVPVVKSLARGLGVSEAWLLTGQGSPSSLDADSQAPALEDVDAAGRRSVAVDAARTHRPLLENLPDWPELLAGARQIAADRGREIPEWAWTALGQSGGLLTGPLSAAAVFDLAKTYADHNIGKPQPAPERETSGVARKADKQRPPPVDGSSGAG